MAAKNTLTNQKLGERFDNAFTLVNYAIGIAKNLIERGEEHPQNPATVVLEAIADNRDLFEKKQEEDVDEELLVALEKEEEKAQAV